MVALGLIVKSCLKEMAIVSTVQVRGKTTFVVVVVSALQREQSTPSNNVARSAGGGIGFSMDCSW